MVFQKDRLPVNLYIEVWEFLKWKVPQKLIGRCSHIARLPHSSNLTQNYFPFWGYYLYKRMLHPSTTVHHWLSTQRDGIQPAAAGVTSAFLQMHGMNLNTDITCAWLLRLLWLNVCKLSCIYHRKGIDHISYQCKFHFHFRISYSLSNIMFKWSTFDVFTLYWAHYTMNLLMLYFQFFNYFIRNSVIIMTIC